MSGQPVSSMMLKAQVESLGKALRAAGIAANTLASAIDVAVLTVEEMSKEMENNGSEGPIQDHS